LSWVLVSFAVVLVSAELPPGPLLSRVGLWGRGTPLMLPEREPEFPSWEGEGWVSDAGLASHPATHPLPLPGGELSGSAAKNLP